MTRPWTIAATIGASVAVFVLWAAPAPGQAPERPLENDVKAAYVFNFTKYVDWPSAAFQAGNEPFRVCVLAEGSFAESVDRLIAGESAFGRPLTRFVPSTPEAARTCHILFIGQTYAARLPPYLSAVRGAPVLTVGESSDFLTRGGAIAFVSDSSRIRFDVNVSAARTNGLTISSRLLRVARSVSGGL